MDYIQAIVLGIVQGLTEFLPISSSAHLILFPWLLGWARMDNQLAFSVALHLGTLLAVLLFFFWEWAMIIATYIGDLRMKKWAGSPRGSLLPKILFATIPAAAAGKYAEPHIEAWFYSPAAPEWLMAIPLVVFGLALLLADRFGRHKSGLYDITYAQAFLIGCFQAIAILPGTSRSGITITAALMLGLQREGAARFSFLLGTPIIAGAFLLEAPGLVANGISGPLIAGVVASALTGLLVIGFLLKFVQRFRYDAFAYYRFALAALIVGLTFYRAAPPVS